VVDFHGFLISDEDTRLLEDLQSSQMNIFQLIVGKHIEAETSGLSAPGM
jgi:hypothetical protein